jgi:hypothetical protein
MENTVYIFDKENAIEQKKNHERNFRKQMNRCKVMTGVYEVLFWSVVPVFVTFMTLTVYAWVTGTDLFGESNILLYMLLTGMGCVFIPISADVLRGKINAIKDKNIYDTYNAPLWFLYFTNRHEDIDSAEMSIESENRAMLHIYYYDYYKEYGRVRHEYVIDNFKIVKTNDVKQPVLNINQGIYYIPKSMEVTV